MIVAYGIMAFISVMLLIGYCTIVSKKEFWLLLLYISVTVVNLGYLMLASAREVGFAIFANDVVYFGSIFISMCMLLTIIKLCGFKVGRRTVIFLLTAGVVMFGIVATSGFLPLYYKEVTLKIVDGGAKLEKVYGILHPTYLVYVLGYFAGMVACIVHSVAKHKVASRKQAALLAAIVFGNIAVWIVESLFHGILNFCL